MKINLLLTSVGAPGFDAALRSIKEFSDLYFIETKVVGIDSNSAAYGSHLVDMFYNVLPYNNPRFVKELDDIINQESIDFIIPLGDYELAVLANDYYELCLINDARTLDIVQNKANLFTFLKNRNQTEKYCIDFIRCNNLPQINKFLDVLLTKGSKACIKPSNTSGSRGFAIIDKINLASWGIDKTPYATIEQDCFLREIKCSPREDLMLMEYITGDEYSVDCYISTGPEPPTIIPRCRNRITSGICTEAHVRYIPELIDASLDIINELGLRGNLNLQFKLPSSGPPKLLEINPRLAGTVEACRGAGANLILFLLCDFFNLERNEFHIRWGTIMKRTYKELFIYADEARFI